MAIKPVRNNDYYLDLLKREHPVIFGEYKAGKYPTVAKALIAAGIKTERTPLQELTNAWRKASTTERDAFLRNIRVAVAGPATTVTMPVTSRPFSIGRVLQPAAIKGIQDIMARRKLEKRDVMDELGRKRLNASIWMAFSRPTLLQQDLIDELEAWVARH